MLAAGTANAAWWNPILKGINQPENVINKDNKKIYPQKGNKMSFPRRIPLPFLPYPVASPQKQFISLSASLSGFSAGII